MSEAPLSLQDEDDALAAEYVLGVLSPEERAAFERRLKAEAALAARVAVWEDRFAGMNEGFAPARAPDLLPAIEARLFPGASPARPVRRAPWWLLAPLAAAALIAALIFAVPREATLVARLQTKGGELVYEVRHQGAELQIARVAGTAAAAGQVHELWIIAPEAAPVSLGLLDEAAETVPYPMPPRGWVMAVSIEPAGGSPTGAPTGPVILRAEIGA
jgi:anti-sigma-K factor RskA